MPSTPVGIIVDPNGRTSSVTITAASGAAVSAYTTKDGASTHTFPVSVSAETEFWLTQPAAYVVSASGDAGADGEGNSLTVDLQGGGVRTVQLGAADDGDPGEKRLERRLSAFASLFVVDAATYGDGVTDATAHIQAKIDAASAAGGGVVYIPTGIYMHDTLTITTPHVAVVGEGFGTVLKRRAGTAATASIAISGSVWGLRLRDFMIDGNRSVVTSTSAHGISITNTASFSTTYGDDNPDSGVMHHLLNLWIYHTKGDGINATSNAGVVHFDSIKVNNCSGYGFRGGFSDCVLDKVHIGQTGKSSFYLGNSAAQLQSCKAYKWALTDGGYAFEIRASFAVLLTNCHAQESITGSGAFLVGGSHSILRGCHSEGSVGAALTLDGAQSATVDLVFRQYISGAHGTIRHGKAIALLNNPSGNRVSLHGFDVLTDADWWSGTTTGQNIVRIYAGDGDNVRSVTYAATITPQPYYGWNHAVTLTGSPTIANPVQRHKGQRLRFLFTQDATGGRVVTWGTDFRVNWTPDTTAGRTNVIEFVFDGAKWVQAATATGLA